jgi:hypothetical protein
MAKRPTGDVDGSRKSHPIRFFDAEWEEAEEMAKADRRPVAELIRELLRNEKRRRAARRG